MASKFGWVDFAEEDRQKMLDVVKLFRIQGTRDELGVGTIRDAFSEHFFPGTMTMQTRARYFFFVPWLYGRVKNWVIRKPRTPQEVGGHLRRLETRLIYALLEGGDDDGVIGSSSLGELQRMPSSIYWSGLRTLGIRLYAGSQSQYHRRLAFRSPEGGLTGPVGLAYRSGEADDPTEGAPSQDWHGGLPHPPESFPSEAELPLRHCEAEYLADRIIETHPDSLFAVLLLRWHEHVDADYLWEHPVVVSLQGELCQTVEHAHSLSECVRGAALLYNLMLAEKDGGPDLIGHFEELLSDWVAEVQPCWGQLRNWVFQLQEFWRCPALRFARIPGGTKTFIDKLLEQMFGDGGPEAFSSNPHARELIRARELQLKGPKRARLESYEALARWAGESGTERLVYRWPTARNMLADICSGLDRPEETESA